MQLQSAKSKFKKGDRVQRKIDVFDDKSPLKYGTVSLRYSKQHKSLSFYPELYRVDWDNGSVGTAYLPHGLTLIQ